jgi:peptidoglycan hydrolase-like protein with peptidoglycan-binding domain
MSNVHGAAADAGTHLRPGDAGPPVQLLQQWLIQLGYSCETTGTYDIATETAVREYQEARRLTPTGECDETTYGYISLDQISGQRPGPFPDTAPSPTHVLVDRGGNVVAQGTLRRVDRQGPDGSELPSPLRQFIEWNFPNVFMIPDSLGATIAFGVDADAGSVGIPGVSGSIGVYVGPNREMGWYTSVGVDIGLLLGVSAMLGSTYVVGEASNLGGSCIALEVGGNLPIPFLGMSGAVLFNDHGFLGIATEVGFSAGLVPVSSFVSLQETTLHPI